MKKIVSIAFLALLFSCNEKTKCKNYIYIQGTPISYTSIYGFVNKGSRLYEIGENKSFGFYIQAFKDGQKIGERFTDSANLNATIEFMKAQIICKDSTICF